MTHLQIVTIGSIMAIILMLVIPALIQEYLSRKQWRVIYPCGRKSIPMPHRMARDYAEIFDGVVERIKQ